MMDDNFIPLNNYQYDRYTDNRSLEIPLPIPSQEYPLNEENIQKYLNYLRDIRHNDEVALIIEKILANTQRVSFNYFIELLNSAADDFIDYIEDRSWIGLISNLDKSELWVMRILYHIRPDVFDNMKYLVNLDELESILEETDINTIVFFDDGIFSGIHTINILEEARALMRAIGVNSRNYAICLVSGVLGSDAISNISTIKSFRGIEFLFGELVEPINSYLSDEELDLLKEFYEPPEGDNDLANQYSVYFDHKMPGLFSGLPFVYLGDNPYGDPNIPLISGCEEAITYDCPPVPYRRPRSS